jgi:hypothetical protein
VSAETGLIVMLPQSLYQTSMRTSALASAWKPALASAAQTASTRAGNAAGGLADDQSFADVVAHAARRGARCREVDDAAEDALERQPGEQGAAGSTLASGPARAWQREGATTARRSSPAGEPSSGPSSGAIASATTGQRRRLDGDDDELLRAERRRIVARLQRHRERSARALDVQAVGADAGKRLAAREGRDVVAGAGEARRDQAADGAEADHGDLHEPSPVEDYKSARLVAATSGRTHPSGKIARSFDFLAPRGCTWIR